MTDLFVHNQIYNDQITPEERIRQCAVALANLSPYSLDEALAIVRAIAGCKPLSEIAPLLVLSHDDITKMI